MGILGVTAELYVVHDVHRLMLPHNPKVVAETCHVMKSLMCLFILKALESVWRILSMKVMCWVRFTF